jgi:hypothetical protein
MGAIMIIVAFIAVLVICYEFHQASSEDNRLEKELQHSQAVLTNLLIANAILVDAGVSLVVENDEHGSTIILRRTKPPTTEGQTPNSEKVVVVEEKPNAEV